MRQKNSLNIPQRTKISLEIQPLFPSVPAFGPVKALSELAEMTAMEWPAGMLTQLDATFPYICFSYGAVMTVVLTSDALNRIADERLPVELVEQWRSHRPLALFCLVAGTVWIMQNLWLT